MLSLPGAERLLALALAVAVSSWGGGLNVPLGVSVPAAARQLHRRGAALHLLLAHEQRFLQTGIPHHSHSVTVFLSVDFNLTCSYSETEPPCVDLYSESRADAMRRQLFATAGRFTRHRASHPGVCVPVGVVPSPGQQP